jgi:hypothetical protein
MNQHQLYLNLDDNDYVVARCSCGKWEREKMVEQEQEPAELYQLFEQEFQQHVAAPDASAASPA